MDLYRCNQNCVVLITAVNEMNNLTQNNQFQEYNFNFNITIIVVCFCMYHCNYLYTIYLKFDLYQ